jgi:hypothetical protein
MAVWSRPSLFEAYSNRRIDSEFFGPKYVEAEKRIRQCTVDELGHLGVFVPGPFGSAFHVKNYDLCTQYRYIRGRDVKPFFLMNDDNRYVPEQDFCRLRSYAVGPEDLMISVVGTLGNVSICTTNDTPAIFSCKSTVFRTQAIDPYYLLAFLNCHYGSLCLLRRQRGAVQTGLNIEDLRTVPVPRFEITIETHIAQNIRKAHQALIDSKTSYDQAQHLLESELGLDKLSFQKPVGYTAQFSEIEQSRRVDAEFFHTKYKPFMSAVKAYQGGWASLNLLTNRIFPNFNGKRISEYYDYIEIGDINISDGAYISNRISVKHLPANAKIILSGGETLISQVRPTRGAIAIVDDVLSYPTICSGAFYVCTVKDQNQREAIWLYLRLIKAVFEKYCGGTSYPTIESNYIDKFPVPIFERKLAQKIRNLVIQSKEAKKESQRLLALTKTRVEQLIEEAAARP